MTCNAILPAIQNIVALWSCKLRPYCSTSEMNFRDPQSQTLLDKSPKELWLGIRQLFPICTLYRTIFLAEENVKLCRLIRWIYKHTYIHTRIHFLNCGLSASFTGKMASNALQQYESGGMKDLDMYIINRCNNKQMLCHQNGGFLLENFVNLFYS